MSRIGLVIALAALGAGASACVTTGTYQLKADELAKAQKDAAAEKASLEAQVTDLKKQLADKEAALTGMTAERDATKQKLDDAQKALDTARTDLAATHKQLDDGTALIGALKQKLEKLGQNVDKLTSEKGQLSAGLTDAQTRLEELRKQKAAAEARAQVFRDLVAKLHAMIDSGQLKVVIRDGRMLIALSNDVLFDSGKTDIKPDGQKALGAVARVLSTINDRRFNVSGNTDDVPIHSVRFPSNWELSTERAVGVTRFLIANGMKPEVLAAAGHAEFDPIAKNDTPEHRAANRRIEIVLQPNLSDLPSLDGIDGEKKAAVVK